MHFVANIWRLHTLGDGLGPAHLARRHITIFLTKKHSFRYSPAGNAQRAEHAPSAPIPPEVVESAGKTQSPYSPRTVPLQSPLQSPLEKTIVPIHLDLLQGK